MTDTLKPPFLTIALTGTPGTGKTEVSNKLEAEGYHVLHLTEFIKEQQIPSERDTERNCDVVDLDALEIAVFEYQQQACRQYNNHFFENKLTFEDFHKNTADFPVLLIESHMSHYLCDLCVVLRTHPNTLKTRLDERGYSEKKVMENLLAESIDVVLCDCYDYCRRVYEIDTTDTTVEETTACMKELIHALYDDELKKYLELNSKITSCAEDQKVQQAIAADVTFSEILSTI
ncbi:MAG: adenylate kinase family protein [Methanimicrococcus sp.]|nr:adenylate kinase family protein [Methanimicrococcus sp.]